MAEVRRISSSPFIMTLWARTPSAKGLSINKNVHSVGFEHGQNLQGFSWPDIKDEGPLTQRTALEDVKKAVQASSSNVGSSGGLFAWKQMGRKPQKLEVKVEGNPNKHKNLSKIRIKSVGKEVKRYETTTASTFVEKQAQMQNRRASFDTSKPHPLHHSSMQASLQKSLMSPWKRPSNWLSSFKPAAERKLRKSGTQKAFTPRGKFGISNVDMTSNKLEMKNPLYRSAMKETFVNRNEYTEVDRTDQKLRRMYATARFSMGDYDLTKRIPNTRRSVFYKLQENKDENSKHNQKNKNIVLVKDAKVTETSSNINPKNKNSCHSKFFKKKSKSMIRISFKEFCQSNEFNKEMKDDLLTTHYKLGEKDDKINSVNREFLKEKTGEEWTHEKHNEDEEDEEELLRTYFKRREETQNFTFKSDINTENFDPTEAQRVKFVDTPNLNKTTKLGDHKPMTNLEFTRTNFKLGHLSSPKSKSAQNFFKSKSMPEIKEVEENLEEPDPLQAHFNEIKQKFQQKRINEVNSMKKLADKNSKIAKGTHIVFGKEKNTFQPSLMKTSYVWNRGAAL